MKKIGNIIHNEELVNHKKVDYINYHNKLNDIDYNLPTLIVGWNNVKENNINTSILNKTIKDGYLYWEYEFNENKQEHVDGVYLFSKLVPYRYFNNNYNYEFIDPIFNKIKNIDDLNSKMPCFYEKIYYNSNMLYCLFENKIYGIDLNIMDFFNMKKKEILLFFSKKTTTFVNDETSKIFMKYFKFFNGFEYTKKYLITQI